MPREERRDWSLEVPPAACLGRRCWPRRRGRSRRSRWSCAGHDDAKGGVHGAGSALPYGHQVRPHPRIRALRGHGRPRRGTGSHSDAEFAWPRRQLRGRARPGLRPPRQRRGCRREDRSPVVGSVADESLLRLQICCACFCRGQNQNRHKRFQRSSIFSGIKLHLGLLPILDME